MNPADLVLMVAGTILVMFVPGYVWSYVFFNSESKRGQHKVISMPERIVWSFALSMGIVPISFFIVNAIVPIPVDGYTVIILMATLSALGLIALYVRAKWPS